MARNELNSQRIKNDVVWPPEHPSPLHSIHIVNLLTDGQAARCLELAQDHADRTRCWDQPDFSRHASYATCDFAVDDNARLHEYLFRELDFETIVLNELGRSYGIPSSELSFLDLFCAHYQSNDPSIGPASAPEASASTTMDRLEAHRDGSILSFTVLLNPPTQFAGGGTFFDALRDVVPPADGVDAISATAEWHSGGVVRPTRCGDAVLHTGKALHGAETVTRGNRTVLVGFVDVPEWRQRPGALQRACRDWGRLDVAQFRHRRQQDRTENGNKPGWALNHDRWLPRNSKCIVRSYCPAFPTVGRRASAGFQRRQRLRAEDLLLRTILLSEDAACSFGHRDGSASPVLLPMFGGDISVL